MSKETDRKSQILGMGFHKASYRLLRRILYGMLIELNRTKCYRCKNEIMSVNDLSVEHKKAWQSSENPLEMFFDLSNISFSHKSCNSKAAVNPRKKYATKEEYKREMMNRANAKRRFVYDPDIRRIYYERTGY